MATDSQLVGQPSHILVRRLPLAKPSDPDSTARLQHRAVQLLLISVRCTHLVFRSGLKCCRPTIIAGLGYSGAAAQLHTGKSYKYQGRR